MNPLKHSMLATIISMSLFAYLPGSEAFASPEASSSGAVVIDEYKLASLKKLALNGAPEAQFILGTLYEFGTGVTADSEIALRYYKMAAANRHAKAMYQLSAIYSNGRFGEKDSQAAAQYLQRASDHGLPIAQVQQAKEMLAYHPEDKADAAWELLLTAAERNNYEAKYLTVLLSTDPSFPHKLNDETYAEYLTFLAKRDYQDSYMLFSKLRAAQTTASETARNESNNTPVESLAMRLPKLDADVEVITVTAEPITFDFLVDSAIEQIKDFEIYDGNSTGSRIPGKACTRYSNPPCSYSKPGILTGTAAGGLSEPIGTSNNN